METLIIYPKNKEELRATKIFLKTLKVPFKTKEDKNHTHDLNENILTDRKKEK